jgi:glycosyltransferase involved in cell wall biosynthesis
VLQKQLEKNSFEVIVIDNASTDNTKDIVQKFSGISYLYEPNPGLSIARNLGFSVASGEWIGYLDDDAMAHSNLLDRAQWIIENYDFDAFGGVYYPWYKYGRPKWLPTNFGSKVPLRSDIGVISDGFLSGNIMFFRKKVLAACGGFSTNLGMTEQIGYGEDDDVQVRLRAMGFKIGFDPKLAIDHCVMPHKLKLYWHLKSEYAKFRDRQSFLKQYSKVASLLGLIKSALGVGIKIPLGLVKLIFSRNYYWQHIVLDAGIPVARRLGVIRAVFAKKK